MFEQLCILKYYLYYKYWLKFPSRAALERWQRKKIKRHLHYVARHSLLYRGKKSLESCPKTEKSFMMGHFDELNTVGIRREEAEKFAVKAERDRDFEPKLKGVTVGLSSGTSGKRGIFLVSEEERMRWAGYILAKFLPGTIFNSYCVAFFMRADSNLYRSVGSKRIRFHFFDLYLDMEEHRRHLEEIQPQILVGPPSVLLMLAKEKEQGSLHIAPEIILSIAEVLEKEDEKWLKGIFGLKVIHQVYQCTEGCLATTCRYGTLHLNEDVVHIEREYLDAHRFVPVVTDFERRAQPIIRYRLNDILVEKKGGCRCKNPCLALEKIEGREDDVFYFVRPDGTRKAVFPDFIRRCMIFAEKGLKTGGRRGGDYRVIQETDNTLTVYADLTEKEEERVRDEFERLSREQDWILPEMRFLPYACEQGRKLKRVERKGKKG